MNRVFLLPFFLFIIACSSSRNSADHTGGKSIYQPYIDSIIKEFAPDKRVALVDFFAEGRYLKGETNLPEARAALVKRLQSAGLSYVDSIRILPDPGLNGKIFAVSSNSVSNLRSQPRHSAELSTQVVLGTPLNVLKQSAGWYLVQSPDQYLAWVDAGGITLMDSLSFNSWKSASKLIFTDPIGFAFGSSEASPIADLVYGSVLEMLSMDSEYFEARFPDGRTAKIKRSAAMPLKEWISSRKPVGENLVVSSKQLMGIPYLWGGTSFKGVDCSGFTKTVYFMNGLVIPRDASQQVNIGEEIDTSGNWGLLRNGDLLFFGVPAGAGKPERVVHVGMWIEGNQEFIHSSGRVRISSMNPAAANYDADEHKRFLRAKRIPEKSALIDLRKSGLYNTEL